MTIFLVPVWSGGRGIRVAGDTPKYAELFQTWAPLGTPPSQKNIFQNVLRVFTKGFKLTDMPVGGLPGKGSETENFPDALRATTPA